MSITQPTLTTEQKNEITSYVNIYRAIHQAPPLTWDDTIASFSQQWSFNLVSNGIFVHSKTPIYGENLAYFQGYGTDVMTLIKKSIDNWYNEVTKYDFNAPGFSDATGHFTCMVWLSSTKFGMGISLNDSTNAVDVVMNTSPPGNVIGEFQQNVLPSNGSPTPTPTPIPTPTPNPTPIPTPIPIPPPIHTPSPVFIYAIVNKLNSVIYELQTKKRKNIIVYTLNDVIDKLTMQTSIRYSIINELYNAVTMVNNKQPVQSVIRIIYHVIYELLNIPTDKKFT